MKIDPQVFENFLIAKLSLEPLKVQNVEEKQDMVLGKFLLRFEGLMEADKLK